jgi:hypothetical protein
LDEFLHIVHQRIKNAPDDASGAFLRALSMIFYFFLLIAARPSRPEPRRIRVRGSGTVLIDSTKKPASW